MSQDDRKEKKKGDKKKKTKKEEGEGEEEEEEFHWWEHEDMLAEGLLNGDRSGPKWSTLEHNGVLFAPPYVPHNIPIKYEGKVFQMTPEEEEIATMFAGFRENQYYKNEVFRINFFDAWTHVLYKRPEGRMIKKLEYCNFDAIWDHIVAEREARRNLPKEQKKKITEERKAMEKPYAFCMWDGRKEPVTGFKVEPPGLFRGRGKHPKMGCLKTRTLAEDITINCSEDAKVPSPPPGHKWKEVVHKREATWLCMWHDSVNGNTKYVMPSANGSSVKGYVDRMKFEKARKLKDLIDDIRKSYTADFHHPDAKIRGRAVAMYFIDKLALRVGGEKDESEADTVGCCSLRVEHVTPQPPNKIHFDFLGKDSIRYLNTVEVVPRVYDLVCEFRKGKDKEDKLFPFEVIPPFLNDHLSSIMPGLTAKVFRTYNASITLDREFYNNPVDMSLTEKEKVAYFTAANTKVAILCNHQKAAHKNFEVRMATMDYRTEVLESLIDRIQKCQTMADSGKEKKAIDFWYEEEDRIQWEWLNKYGTEEEKEAYRAECADPERRTVTRSSTSGKKRTKSESTPTSARKRSSRKKEVKSESDDDDDLTISQIKAKGKASKKKPVKEESESSEDEPVGNLRKKEQHSDNNESEDEPAAKRRGAKAPPKKQVKQESDESESGDEPVGNLRKKASPKKASPKKGKGASKPTKDESSEDEPIGKARGRSPARESSPAKEEDEDANAGRRKRVKK